MRANEIVMLRRMWQERGEEILRLDAQIIALEIENSLLRNQAEQCTCSHTEGQATDARVGHA